MKSQCIVKWHMLDREVEILEQVWPFQAKDCFHVDAP